MRSRPAWAMGEESLFQAHTFSCNSLLREVRAQSQGGAEAETTEEGSLSDLLIQLSYTVHPHHLTRDGASHSGLGPTTSTIH